MILVGESHYIKGQEGERESWLGQGVCGGANEKREEERTCIDCKRIPAAE